MPYDVGDALSRIEQILLNSMQRNLHRHLHEEQDEGMQWTMWQTEQLTALRTWSARNLKAHTPAFTKINDAAIRLLEDSGKQAELSEERQLLADGIQQAGAFFHAPEDKVRALLTSVRHDLSRAEYSILRQADDVYRKAVFDAQVYLQTGSGTLENAIDMAVQDLQRNGIQSVVYRNGRRVEASTYARMALRSANVRARLAGEGKARDKYGIHTVIAPPSGIACEKCVKWLCRVLVDDVYCSGTAAEADALGVPLLSQAIAQGFLHPQCNCSLHTYHTGSPVLEMSQEERDEAVRKYRLTQKQRYNERQIRKWKRAEQSAPDETACKAAAARRREWQNVNRQLCDEHHDFLRRDYNREKIYDAPESVIVPDCIEKPQPSEPVPSTPVQPAPLVPEKIQPAVVAIAAPDKMDTDVWISPKTVEMKLTDGAESGIMKQENKMPTEYAQIIQSRYDSATPMAKSIYNKYVPSGGAVVDIRSAENRYSINSNAIMLNAAQDMVNPRGAGTSWFHEHGHYVDVNAGNISQNEKFKKAILFDFKAYEKKFRLKHLMLFADTSELRKAIGKDLVSLGSVSHSIQDILGGVIGKPYPKCRWKHSQVYWSKKGDNGVTAEAFAHMFEALFSSEKRKLMEKYFPQAWESFLQILEDVI